MEDLEEFKNKNDSRNLYKTVKNLMGKPNHNTGTHLIHQDKEIHDPTEQTELFATTWENIMKPNRPKNTEEVQQNYEMINTWIRQNTETINPLRTINLNNLQKSNTLTTPITLIEITETLKKIKSNYQRNF